MEEIPIIETPKRSKRLLGAAVMAAALGGGAIFGAALGTPATSSAQTDDTTTTAPDGTEATGPRFGHHGPGLDAAATALGMTVDELRAELEAGKTIAEVAGEKGVDVQTVIDAMVAEATADLEARITDLVNNGFPAGGPGGPGHHRGGPGLDAAATALGLTVDELRAELEAGDTIADVAAEQGVDVQTVIDAMVADASARIDEAVAAGDLTADEGEAKKAELAERIADLVNNGFPAHGPGGPRGPGGGPFG